MKKTQFMNKQEKLASQSKQKVLKPLIRSASIILYKNQQILMFQRKANISFANSTVFPGGACDLEDQQQLKKYVQNPGFSIFAKITAIRELFQETGILLLPSQKAKQQQEIIKKIINKKLNQQHLTHKTFVQLWKNNLDLICPVFRLLTVQYLKGVKRFDTIFFTPKEQVLKINFREWMKSNLQNQEQLYKLNPLHISGQGISYLWGKPINILAKAIKNELTLAPPQIIILSCLKNTTHTNICNLKAQQAIQPIMLIPIDKFQKFYLFGDKQYDSDVILKKQPESKSKKQLKQYFQNEDKKQMKGDRKMIIQDLQMYIRSTFYEGSLLGFMNKKSNL